MYINTIMMIINKTYLSTGEQIGVSSDFSFSNDFSPECICPFVLLAHPFILQPAISCGQYIGFSNLGNFMAICSLLIYLNNLPTSIVFSEFSK